MNSDWNINNIRKVIIRTLFLCTGIFVLAGKCWGANYPLEIIAPKEGLDIANRFYKAYPGLEYNVRASVIGGEYPFNYQLITAPAGMTINEITGEISWSNPTVENSPYLVSLSVTDEEDTEATVSWTITVTTTGFYFLDAVNGTAASQGGTGTISNPWKSMVDWYEGTDYDAKYATSYAGAFLYYRSGNYRTDDAYREDENQRIPLVGDFKPQVWLAYPGERPVIDMGGAYINIYGGGSNAYFDGLEFWVNENVRQTGVRIDSGCQNVVFRRNVFYGIHNGVIGGNNALIMITAGGSGSYWSFQDNVAYDVTGSGGYWLLGYSAGKVLVENNYLHDIVGHPIGPKESCNRWDIRRNILWANSGNSINDQYSDVRGPSGNSEVRFNLVKSDGGNVLMNSNQTTTGDPIYIYRNTFLGPLVRVYTVTATNGPFHFYDNVIVNETSYLEKIQRSYIQDESRLLVHDNLTGSASDNIVDASGNLTEGYSAYLGSVGWQILDFPADTTSPSTPGGLIVL